MSRRAIITSSVLLLTGCVVGPDYHRPTLDVPEQYRGAEDADGTSSRGDSFGDSDWHAVYTDPNLQVLINEALKYNYDVKIAAARIEQAASQLGSIRVLLLPQLSVEAQAGRAKDSEYALLPNVPRVNDEAQVEFLATYQLDLWGQLRRMTEVGRANLLGSKYAAHAVALTLVATVARNYFELVSLDSRIEITRLTVASREKLLVLTRAQHERGYVTALDVSTAEAQLAAARAVMPDLQRQIVQSENAISMLVGSNPGSITRKFYGDSVPGTPALPSFGLPAQLLERRPDIGQAEQALRAANAEIGVAKAALFPNISLTGGNGSLSVPFGNLFTAPAAQWSVGVGLVQPLLSAQSNLYQLDLADARKREALFRYQKAVQQAFQEVADALSGYRKYREQVRELAVQVDALGRARSIALVRYQIGYASYFDVIAADKDLFEAKMALSESQASSLTALVRLFSALGGGWQARNIGSASYSSQ